MANSYRNRLKELERAYSPNVLATCRFITDMPVDNDDPRVGHVIEIEHPGISIRELYVFTASREQYHRMKSGLEDKFTLLEC